MSLWLPTDDILAENPEELKSALERYRRVLDGSGYAFWEWGLHDDSYRCGGNFWEKLGYTTLDEVVTCVENVQEYVHPDDFEMLRGVVLDHLRFDTPIDVIYRIRARDGNYWWTQACASSTRDENGRVTFLSGVNFDLSHLKDTEKALRLSEAQHARILAASNDGIWEWSVDENHADGCFHTSHSCWQHLGYSKEEVDSLPANEQFSIWSSHLHPCDLKRLRRALNRHFTLKEPFDIEYRMFGADKIFWVRSRGQAIFNGKGKAILMSGINIDITGLKEAEERVRKAKDDAEKANQAKSHFLSSMSHELRTPLNAIMGFSQLAMYSRDISEDHRNNSAQIHSAGKHLLGLVNDVLDLSKIEAGNVALHVEPVAPVIIIRECFELIRPHAEQRGIRLSFTEGCDSLCVWGDKMRLKQCLLNLISNGVKYNVDGGELAVVISVVDTQLSIAVEDTGLGISEEKQKELFLPFRRLGVENSSIEGSGIGLVITRELLEKMNGNIQYRHKLGGGSSFTILMPIAPADDRALSSLAGSEFVDVKTILFPSFETQKQVLYIEDHPSNICFMENVLKPYPQLGLVCHIDPFVGLYHARASLPDIIILDINLPSLNGYELVHLLKGGEDTQHIPLIALSANAMGYDIEKGKKLGFDEYLTKPLNIEGLASAFHRLLSDTGGALQ